MLVQDLELIKAKVVGNGKKEALAWVAKMQVRFLQKLREIMVNFNRHLLLKFISGKATEIKDTVGKDKEYKAPEFFGYDNYSFYDIEKECVDKRCPQPKSGLSEYW